MALRFQNRPDEIERDVSGTKKVYRWILIVGFFLLTGVVGVLAWISGRTLHSYEQFIVGGAVCFWVVWVVTPYFQALHKRTKEILGIVSDLEQAISAVRRDQERLRESLHESQIKMTALLLESLSATEGRIISLKHEK